MIKNTQFSLNITSFGLLSAELLGRQVYTTERSYEGVKLSFQADGFKPQRYAI